MNTEEKKIEDLLKRRKKIIALWPFVKSELLGKIEVDPQGGKGWEWWEEIDKHPHLFKELFWYEQRKIEEMPEYLKELDVSDYENIQSSLTDLQFKNADLASQLQMEKFSHGLTQAALEELQQQLLEKDKEIEGFKKLLMIANCPEVLIEYPTALFGKPTHEDKERAQKEVIFYQQSRIYELEKEVQKLKDLKA